MNKKTTTIIIATLAVALIGIFLLNILKPKTYTEITFDEYKELLKSDKAFVLFVGSKECSHCTTYKKTANSIVKDYKIDINYIDISNLSTEENANINAHFPYDGTPTTLIIKDGEELGRIEGSKSYAYSVKVLKNTGIIKK